MVAVDNPYIPSKIKGHNVETAEVVGAINTEMKCLVMGTLSTDEPASHFDIYDQLITDHDGDAFQRVRKAEILGILQTTPARLLKVKRQTEIVEGRKRKVLAFTKTDTGNLAAAWAGENLEASSQFLTATRYVYGEKNNQAPVTGINTFDARLTVLYGLTMFARWDWVSLRQFSELLNQIPLSTERLLRHMGKLASVGIVEVKNARYHGNVGDGLYRIARHNGYFDPNDLIETYVTNAFNFTNPSSAPIGEGLRKMKRILADSALIPLLVRRSYASTGHTDKPHDR